MNPTVNRSLFDEWPDKYDQWFRTPLGLLVKEYEGRLILDLLDPRPGEMILDAGCGTGVFTCDILSRESRVIGLDVSLPMLRRARNKIKRSSFHPSAADMSTLPFHDGSFDRAVSVTALEFIPDGRGAVVELFRVTKRGGVIVVATLNSLSPWAARRKEEAKKGHPIFSQTIFRSPEDLRSLVSLEGVHRTAIHFSKEASPEEAVRTEREGEMKGLKTGAFVAMKWRKP